MPDSTIFHPVNLFRGHTLPLPNRALRRSKTDFHGKAASTNVTAVDTHGANEVGTGFTNTDALFKRGIVGKDHAFFLQHLQRVQRGAGQVDEHFLDARTRVHTQLLVPTENMLW